jgi:hypothetical protein
VMARQRKARQPVGMARGIAQVKGVKANKHVQLLLAHQTGRQHQINPSRYFP